MAWYDVGNWVRVNPGIVSTYHLRDEGPFRVTKVEPETRTLQVDAITRSGDHWWLWVSLGHCIPSQPPRVSLVDRERAVLEAEGWRKRRDENLAKAFRPEREVYPTPSPDPKPVAAPATSGGYKMVWDVGAGGFIFVAD